MKRERTLLPSGETDPGGRHFARFRERHSRAAADPSPYAPGRRDTGTCPHVGDNPGPRALPIILFYHAKAWIGGLGRAGSTLGTLRIGRAGARRDVVRHAVRDRLACAALVPLFFVAVVMSPIQRSSTSDSKRPRQGLRRNFALPDSSDLSVTVWDMREGTIVTARSEVGEEDDESCGATRQAYDTYDPSLSPPRGAPARNLAVPGRPSAPRPLRC
jgi:hypothetical protein